MLRLPNKKCFLKIKLLSNLNSFSKRKGKHENSTHKDFKN